MSKKVIVILAVSLLLLASVGLAAVYEGVYGGYTGISARERRLFDPYSRIQYYGIGYPGYVGGYGSKGPQTGTVVGTGAKSAYSGVFQLDTSAYIPEGRSPQRISNYDPRMRGYAIVDRAVDLLPIETITLERDYVVRLPGGTARVLSTGSIYGRPGPEGRVIIQVINLPPVGDNEIYEAWLSDEESGYALSIGLLKVGISGTAKLNFEITRSLEAFDSVMITKEPFPDEDPRPGEIVLIGEVSQPRTALPPQSSKIPLTVR